MSTMRLRAITGIGLLIRLDLSDLDGNPVDGLDWPEHAAPWLAWCGDRTRGTLLVIPAGNAQAGLALLDRSTAADSRAASPHARFHGAEPDGWRLARWTPPHGAMTTLGLACAVRYRIPAGMRSNKAANDWHHAFGDFGNGDDRSADSSFRPLAQTDAAGRLYFKRRRGNHYHIDDWMRA